MEKVKESFIKKSIRNFSSFVNGAISNLIRSQFSTYNRMTRQVRSSDQDYNYTQDGFFENPLAFYKILRNFPFFKMMVNSYVVILNEIIDKNEIEITIKDDKKLEAEVNEFIKKVGIKKYLMDNLFDLICYGYGLNIIDYKEGKLKEIVDTESPRLVQENNMNYFYIVDCSLVNSSDIAEIKVPFTDAFFYYQEVAVLNQMTDRSFKDDLDEDLKKYGSILVQFNVLKCKSIFDDILREVFYLYLHQYILDLLGMSEYLKANVLKITVNANDQDVNTANNVSNDIEALLNENNMSQFIGYQNPAELLNAINYKLSNRFKVVPEVNEFSSLQELNIPDFGQIIDRLNNEIDRRQKMILNKAGIPEEFISSTGGSTNRFDIVLRNEKFHDNINNLLKTFTRCIKDFVRSYVAKKYDKDLSHDAIDFEFDSESVFDEANRRQGMNQIVDEMRELESIVQTADGVSQSELIKKPKFKEFVKKKVESISPEYKDIIDFNKIGKKEESMSPFGEGSDASRFSPFGGGPSSESSGPFGV